jgi:hypothetical protein
MTKDEALKMAIEALLYGTDHTNAVKACKEALEQPAQEPVAWYGKDTAFSKANKIFVFNNKDDADAYGMRKSVSIIPLYTNPHQWKKLKDDEIQSITWQIWGADALEPELDYARAIEQALKDKNT